MKVKVLALESECYSKSFGMLPFIVDAGLLNDYICLGLAPDSPYRKLVPKTEYGAIMRGLMTDVSNLNISVEIDPEKPTTLCVGWLGESFFKESTAIGLPVPDLPQNRNIIEGHGSFWFEDSKVLYERMTSWTSSAAWRVFKEKSVKIASLMQWTLPSVPETLAARWYLKKTKAEKDKEIDFQLRTYRIGKSKKKVIAEYKSMISLYLLKPTLD